MKYKGEIDKNNKSNCQFTTIRSIYFISNCVIVHFIKAAPVPIAMPVLQLVSAFKFRMLNHVLLQITLTSYSAAMSHYRISAMNIWYIAAIIFDNKFAFGIYHLCFAMYKVISALISNNQIIIYYNDVL